MLRPSPCVNRQYIDQDPYWRALVRSRVRVTTSNGARGYWLCTACKRIGACHVQGMCTCVRRVCAGTSHCDASVHLYTPTIHCNTSDVHVRAPCVYVRVPCAHLVRSCLVTWGVMTDTWTRRMRRVVRRGFGVCETCAQVFTPMCSPLAYPSRPVIEGLSV